MINFSIILGFGVMVHNATFNNISILCFNISFQQNVNLNFTHFFRSTDVVPCTFRRYLQSISQYVNKVNIIRATINYLVSSTGYTGKTIDIKHHKLNQSTGYTGKTIDNVLHTTFKILAQVNEQIQIMTFLWKVLY
jgi:hypothetical protein